MTRDEMLEKAQVIRSRDRFGAMTQEELDALPGTETVLKIPSGNSDVTVYEIRPEHQPDFPCPLIINLHGGGFLKGRSDRDHRYCSFLAEALGAVVWDVDYSLAPEFPFPKAVYECYNILQYAFENAAELGFDHGRIALAGHSAGGTLAAASLILCGRNDDPMPCCALMEYFPTEQSRDPQQKLAMLSPERQADPFWIRRVAVEAEYTDFYLRSEADLADPLCAPARASDEELAKFPDSLIISAGTDTLQAETEAFAARLIGCGVTVTARRIPEAMHGFTTNRTEGWEKALENHRRFFSMYL